jgi:hypothetical protein
MYVLVNVACPVGVPVKIRARFCIRVRMRACVYVGLAACGVCVKVRDAFIQASFQPPPLFFPPPAVSQQHGTTNLTSVQTAAALGVVLACGIRITRVRLADTHNTNTTICLCVFWRFAS